MFRPIAMIVTGLAATAGIGLALVKTGPADTAAVSGAELSDSARAVFVEYLACSETAAIRVMSEEEAAPCILLYTQVKLTFVEDVDLDTFMQMPPEERHAVNMQGYAGYVEWRSSNGDLFETLSREARGRIAERMNCTAANGPCDGAG